MPVDIIIIRIFAVPMNAVMFFYNCFDWIGVSYKGSTKDFDSFSRGSIPLTPTEIHIFNFYHNSNYSIGDSTGKEIG